MKKVVLGLMFASFLLSCSVSEKVVSSNYESYSDYASDSFFVSPYGYYGDYEAIGVVNFEVKKETEGLTKSTKEELMKMAIEMAKEKGANGLMNCSCEETVTSEYKKVLHPHANISKKLVYKKSYTFSGLAIKIENN